MYENGACHAPAADRIETAVHRYVVVGHHMLHVDAFHLGHLRRHLKVHHVAGVVLHYHQHALVRSDGPDALQDLVRGRRGKDRACYRGVQHALAHEPAVGRLMAASAAADQGYLALLLLRPHYHVAAVQLLKMPWIRLYHAKDHLVLYLVYCIDEFLHAPASLLFAVHTVHIVQTAGGVVVSIQTVHVV